MPEMLQQQKKEKLEMGFSGSEQKQKKSHESQP